jgi:hypothetical protein
MPYKDKEQEKANRKIWWANLSVEKKKEKQDKANIRARHVKKFLADYKLEKGCLDCGYNKHHSALDFDHVIGCKDLNVCFSKSIGQAKKEIEKCEVVCSNCHRIRTYNRIYSDKISI